jgi:hypothetical protein
VCQGRREAPIGAQRAAFAGEWPGRRRRRPGHPTALGVKAASWHPWHARGLDASVNGEGHARRRRSNTLSPSCLLTLLTGRDYTGQSIGRPAQHRSVSLTWSSLVCRRAHQRGYGRLAAHSTACGVISAIRSCRCEEHRLERLVSAPGGGLCALVYVHGGLRVHVDGTDPAITGCPLAATGPAALYEYAEATREPDPRPREAVHTGRTHRPRRARQS